MYNQKLKEKFLNQFENEDSKRVYEAVFIKSKNLESKFNKDISNFNLKLIEEFILNYIKPSTKQSARTYCNILSSYIQWTIDNSDDKRENPFKKGQEYFAEFVENQNRLYMRKADIDAITFSLLNAQDAFILKGLFEGIQGKKLSELTNLKIQDIEKAYKNNNVLEVVDGDSSRLIEVSLELLKLAESAHMESEYYKKNGEVDYSNNVSERVLLCNSDYILKATLTNKRKGVNTEDKGLTHYSVYNRIEMIKSLSDFEEYSEALTTKNIVRSGMLYEAKKILDEGLKLDRKNIEYICNKYGLKYKWSLKDFLNEETVNSVYS